MTKEWMIAYSEKTFSHCMDVLRPLLPLLQTSEQVDRFFQIQNAFLKGFSAIPTDILEDHQRERLREKEGTL